ncbi:ankyrin repeat domain-containing protein [Phycisphaeraceae bacterium D3-23]
MLLFLSIVFWVSLLVLAPAAFVLLARAVVGKRMKTGYFCKQCHYDRRGIDYQADCPECGCPQSERDGRSNVGRTRRARSPKRIAVMAVLALLVGGMVFGSRWLHVECVHLPTTVSLAADRGKHTKVKFLVGWFPELAQGHSRFSQETASPPLFNAVRQDDKEMIDILLDAGANPDGDPSYPWQIPLREAFLHGNYQTAEHLLEAGADPEARVPGLYGSTLLTIACSWGNTGLVKLLLEYGADPNVMLIEGSPMCVIAHRSNAVELATLLIDAVGDPNANSFPDPPFQNAIWAENLELVEFFLNRGADVNGVYPQTGIDLNPIEIAYTKHRHRPTSRTQAVIDLLRAHGGMTRQELAVQQARQRAAERAAEQSDPDDQP